MKRITLVGLMTAAAIGLNGCEFTKLPINTSNPNAIAPNNNSPNHQEQWEVEKYDPNNSLKRTTTIDESQTMSNVPTHRGVYCLFSETLCLSKEKIPSPERVYRAAQEFFNKK